MNVANLRYAVLLASVSLVAANCATEPKRLGFDQLVGSWYGVSWTTLDSTGQAIDLIRDHGFTLTIMVRADSSGSIARFGPFGGSLRAGRFWFDGSALTFVETSPEAAWYVSVHDSTLELTDATSYVPILEPGLKVLRRRP